MSEKYTEVYVLKITKTQKKTLEKLKDRNIKVANFVRQAIKEKINRDAKELKPKDKKEYYPFTSYFKYLDIIKRKLYRCST